MLVFQRQPKFFWVAESSGGGGSVGGGKGEGGCDAESKHTET